MTDWDFLSARAREIGFVVSVTRGELNFHAPNSASDERTRGAEGAAQELELGRDLESFRPRVSSMSQVSEVEVRGWDPARKEAVVASARPTGWGAAIRERRDVIAGVFGEHRHVTVDRALAQHAEVDEVAWALAEDIGSSWAEADGVAQGDPRLRAGRAVDIGLVGHPFEGRYMLTTTRHVFDERGYRTIFTVSGAQERSLLGLASLGATNGDGTGAGRQLAGVVSAIVSGVEDPERLGRVKLRFPWLSDSYESDWARVATFAAGHSYGAAFLPAVGDEVLVAFEHGEIRRPYVLAALYNGVDKPDLGGRLTASGAVVRRGLRSSAGHRLTFVETGGTRVELSASGDLVVEASGRLELTARGGVSIDGGGGEVKVTGTAIRLN
jgi:phage baseplate assembly protein gpV